MWTSLSATGVYNFTGVSSVSGVPASIGVLTALLLMKFPPIRAS
jgi:hypothetical protein